MTKTRSEDARFGACEIHVLFRSFGHSSFEFVSDFEIRISDFNHLAKSSTSQPSKPYHAHLVSDAGCMRPVASETLDRVEERVMLNQIGFLDFTYRAGRKVSIYGKIR